MRYIVAVVCLIGSASGALASWGDNDPSDEASAGSVFVLVAVFALWAGWKLIKRETNDRMGGDYL